MKGKYRGVGYKLSQPSRSFESDYGYLRYFFIYNPILRSRFFNLINPLVYKKC